MEFNIAMRNKILTSQRTWLLDRQEKICKETQAKDNVGSDALLSLELITKPIVAKQYVEDTQVMDQSDNW